MAPIEELEDEGEIQAGDDENDVEPLREARNPRPPSTAEVEAHEMVHIPYRDWCK